MTTTELEQVIRCCIRDIYKKEYIGKLEIFKLNPIGYSVKLGMATQYQPIVIYAELQDKEFIQFFKQELKNRHLNTTSFGELNLVEPYYPSNISQQYYDTTGINRQNR